ncbi:MULTISPECIES: hypothetical protein [Streptomycetaceae]|uniref:Peptidoglycan binding domain-containing protein n=1 Tax=Streptantibioticus cattleyicolor (strain ATCC 35852 / DSM 46488 / JCM 4925 / NBRC 14057 / NRRL 8057) TaxID=1003195 RepID=F8K3M0_STREN|nr:MULTISPECIES: hypothetical protein [Streptomycetaceae]AEW96340.1 hypothetical protein SCATT_39690 [Streptantibioticus cattleyicolor NRRL 8057 = DSM 46488]MYS60855.1 hypothetical protein [Streptomyces sp. SID5468]CCB76680.1 conserved protein of unknown function [Streptantibioticus cattleyicolor NRRL 8057 = DSM 46488]
MSRETDSSSSGPQGRGGAAYPSGTPPYGTGQYPSQRPQEEPLTGGSAEAAAEERKTETTLTTRIRINIPGSRPIPPVVVRTPVGEEEAASGAAGRDENGGGHARTADGAPGAASARVPGAATTLQGAAGEPSPGAAATGGTATGGGAPGGEKKTSDWFAPRKPVATPGAGGPGTGATGTAGPVVQAAPAAPRTGDPFGAPAAPGASVPRQPEVPYFGGGAPAGPAVPEPDAGAVPPAGSVPFPGGPQAPGAPGTGFDGAVGGAVPQAPAGPTTGPVTGTMRTPAAAGPVTGVDAPAGGPGGAKGKGRTGSGLRGGSPSAVGDTLVGGIPAVPAADDKPAPQFTAPRPPEGGRTASAQPGKTAPSGGTPAKAAKGGKGRNKLALAGGGVLVLAAVAYGAGLLMDHADVPNGTVVLGTDIGGKTKEDALKALDPAVGSRATAPLRIRVGDQDKELKPALAGLAVDPQETVRRLAHRDYNPVSVVRSLFGGTRQAQPAVTVDQEKLRSQVQTLTAGTGTGGGADGMVKFVAGKPVVVPGTPHQAVDLAAAVRTITDAYEHRVTTGSDAPVVLPVTTQQSKVTKEALDKAVREIGAPAMSGRVVVVAGTRSVPFSPEKSLSKILTIVPAGDSGQLTLHIDLAVLKDLYGTAFDGVLLERGTGARTPVTPQDVASAMMAQLGRTAAVKTAVIPNVAP